MDLPHKNKGALTSQMELMGQVREHLRDDEQLLWHGAPDASVWFTAEDVFLIPFSILWCVFAIFWESSVIGGSAPFFFRLWGIPFVALGLYFVVGRFFYKSYRKRRTVYAITTRRAMVLGPRSFADLPLRDQPVVIKRSRDSRHASVTFMGALLPGRATQRRRRGGRIGYVPGPSTGMELLSRNTPQPFAFYDVLAPDPMLRALEQARSQTTA
jgi:hypothetical protein